MAGSAVHLGYLGRPLPDEEQPHLGTSRIGGRAVWPLSLPEADAARGQRYFDCELCEQKLFLLGQFAAGYREAPSRMLHLFCCARPECNASPKAWRAVRTLGPPPVAHAEVVPEAAAPVAQEASWAVAEGGDDWGAGGDDWGAGGDDWGAAPAASGSLDAELDVLMAAQAAPTVPAKAPVKAKREERREGEEEEAWLGVSGPGPEASWPCFALEIYDEPPKPAESGEHEEELLQRYLRSELAEEGADPPAEAGEAGEEEDEEDEADCDEDEDEEDEGRVDWFGRFQTRVRRSPTHVLRYSWGGAPLWMSSPSKQPPPACPLCGAPRTFELQVMPTLPYRYGIAAGVSEAWQQVGWGSVCVFTCSADCQLEGSAEESVFIQPPA